MPEREPEPWESGAAALFLWIETPQGNVEVWAPGGDRTPARSYRPSIAVSARAESRLVDAWRGALCHAGLNEGDFYLLPCPGAPADEHAKGNNYEPGVEQGEDEFRRGEVLAEANVPEHRAKHRVAVFTRVGEGERLPASNR